MQGYEATLLQDLTSPFFKRKPSTFRHGVDSAE